MPIASPRSACASAAASLTPSPTIATTRPSVLQPLDHVDLVGGQHAGDHLVDADLGGDRAGGPLVVAGEQHRRQPEAAQPAHRLGGGRLHGVGDDEHAARPAVPADRDRRCGRRPRAASTAAGSSGGSALRPVREQPRPADQHGVAVDDALHAEPLDVGELLDRGRGPVAGAVDDGPGHRVLRGRPRGRPPAGVPPRPDSPAAATTSTSAIRPVVTVPVLSSTTVSTRRVDSSTSGPLIRMPSWAPRPVPTISAVGVASPSAHGQAMISTATAAVNAAEAPAPATSQPPRVPSASAITSGHEDPGDPVGEPLHLGLAVLGLLDQPGHLRQLGVGADPGGADDEPPAGVDGRPGHRVAGADLDRHRLAGEHRGVDRGGAALDDPVGGDLLAGADHEQRRRPPAARPAPSARRRRAAR